MRVNTTEARPRGPNQPTKATVARSSPEPRVASPHGHHAHHGQGEDGEGHVGPGRVLEPGDHHRHPEPEPHEQRDQLAEVVGEAQGQLVVGGASSPPKAIPATKAATKPLAPASSTAEYPSRASPKTTSGRKAGPPKWYRPERGAGPAPRPPPTPTPMAAPTTQAAQGPRRPPRCGPPPRPGRRPGRG